MSVAEFVSPLTGTYIRLDAVESFSSTLTGSPTMHPLENGSTVSDHYKLNNKRISFSGIISDFKLHGVDQIGIDPVGELSTLTPADFVSEVESLMKARQSFTVYLDEDFNPIPDCVITSFDPSRTVQVGKGLRVAFSIEQLTISERARLTTIEVPAEVFEADGSETQDQGQQSTKTVSSTLFKKGADQIIEAAGFGGTDGTTD